MCDDAGVADQLQTNYASDLRSILKTLFEVMATKCDQADNDKQKKGEEHVIVYISFIDIFQSKWKIINHFKETTRKLFFLLMLVKFVSEISNLPTKAEYLRIFTCEILPDTLL